ncbi:MAG: hypothetical protein V7765_09310 [Oleispira sp.]
MKKWIILFLAQLLISCGGKAEQHEKDVYEMARVIAGDTAIVCGIDPDHIFDKDQCVLDAFYQYKPFYSRHVASVVLFGHIREVVAFNGRELFILYTYCDASDNNGCINSYSTSECFNPVVYTGSKVDNPNATDQPFLCDDEIN